MEAESRSGEEHGGESRTNKQRQMFALTLSCTLFSLGLRTQQEEILEEWLAALSKAQNQTTN